MNLNELSIKIKKALFSGCAFYVSDDFIDIAVAEDRPRAVKLMSIQRIPFLRGANREPFTDGREYADKIYEKIFPDEDNKPYRVAVNLKNDSFVLRHFRLRDIAQKDLDQAIVFEAQKYLPYSLDDLVYKFKSDAKRSGINDIIFIASNPENIAIIRRYFDEKNIIPSIIEPNAILLASSLALSEGLDKTGTYLLVHYEPSNKAILTGISNMYPYYYEEIAIYPTDEEFKTSELGYPTLKDVWNIIEKDIFKGVEFLRRETSGEVLKVLISGFQPLSDEKSVSKDFGIPVERITASFYNNPVEHIDRYLPALSLLRDSMTRPGLNLAAGDSIHNDLRGLRKVFLTAAGIFLAIIAVHLSFLPMISSLRKNTDSLKGRINIVQIPGLQATAADIQKMKEVAEKNAGSIDAIVACRYSIAQKIARVSSDIPKNAWIDSLQISNVLETKNYSGKKLVLTGGIYAGGEQGLATANTIVETIKKDAILMTPFTSVELISAEKTKRLDKEITKFVIALK